MQLIRFRTDDGPRWGVRNPETDDVRALEEDPFTSIVPGAHAGRASQLQLLPPCDPARVVALAYNYSDLVGERDSYDEPLMFLKSPGSVVADGAPIRIPAGCSVVWVEVELAFVVGRTACNVPAHRAAEYILGYTVANDVTTENVHGRDWHLARSKALDTFCPTGPWLETDLRTSELRLDTRINGRVTQESTTARRILDDAHTLSLISRFITLEPGDLVLTGTPRGARESLVVPGDVVEQSIEGIGKLMNPVIGDSAKEQ